MSSGVDPIVMGVVAAGLALVLIAIIAKTRRPLERMRLRRRERRNLKRLTRETTTTATERVRPLPTPSQRPLRTPTLGDAAERHQEVLPQAIGVNTIEPTDDARRSESELLLQDAARRAEEMIVATERQCATLLRQAEAKAQLNVDEIAKDARRRARQELERAELEAKRIVEGAAEERGLPGQSVEERAVADATQGKLSSLAELDQALRNAEEQLALAERRRAELLSESESEAQRMAGDVIDGARGQARRLLEEAQLEAAGIVADARNERARLVDELARERSVLEDTRTTLSGLLTDALEEVETGTGTSHRAATVQDLDEARALRTSTGADR